jgi:regulation of enolase protein 1 (concanavalin A-like superfamily)
MAANSNGDRDKKTKARFLDGFAAAVLIAGLIRAGGAGGVDQSEWKDADVGMVGRKGGLEFRDGAFLIRGSGADVWMGGDAFHYAWVAVKGDAEVIARVAEMPFTHQWAKHGVMIRESMEYDSKMAFVCVTPGEGAAFQWREGKVDKMGSRRISGKAPCWVRLARKGDHFSAWVSANGADWTEAGNIVVGMAPCVRIGLAVCSHATDGLAEVTFDNVSVRGETVSEGEFNACDAPAEHRVAGMGGTPDPRDVIIDRLAEKFRNEREKLVFPGGKKLIHNGWDMNELFPGKIAANIRVMEEKPFDGVVIRLKGGETTFQPRPWNEADFLDDYEGLARIEWRGFTDNFIWMHCTSPLDWFDEEQWQAVLHNSRILAKAALLGRCAGICFDAETYGAHPWAYKDSWHGKEKTFEEYEKRLELCGKQWMQAVQEVCPRIRILTLFMTANHHLVVDEEYSTGNDRPLSETGFSPDNVHKRLPGERYALLPAFINGMLRAAASDAMIIDGNEGSYYYDKEGDYRKYADYFGKYASRAFFAEDLREKYARQVRLGSSFYPDYYYKGRYGGRATYLSPLESARWTEHNVYWALTTSDEYVWEWGENQDWWEGRLDPGYEQAVRSAREKVRDGRPLGFGSETLFTGLLDRLKGMIPTAELRLGRGKPRWDTAYATGDFIAEIDWNPNVEGKTRARIACDETMLRIAFECREPAVDQMKKDAKGGNNAGVFKDDHVQVLVSSTAGGFPVYRFAAGAGGGTSCVKADSLGASGPVDGGSAGWRCPVSIGKDSWTAEFEIPWKAFGMNRPGAGTRVRLNLVRKRAQKDERTTWAPVLRWGSDFLEPEYFGTVVVR